MPIIIISSDFKDIEEKIAKEVALTMDYQLLDRRILPDIEAGNQIDPGKLNESMETTPSVFKKMTSRQWRYYLACIEANVFETLLKDKIVCWGLSAHLFTTGVSHAMKVRILSSSNRNSGKNSEQKGSTSQGVGKLISDKLEQRKKWSMTAYNQDETDPSGYDLVINLDQIDPAEAVKTITNAVEYLKFQPMTYSIKCLSDLALAAKVNARLLKHMADIKVQARDGSVVVLTKASNRQKRKKIAAIKDLAGGIEGVRYVEVHVKKNILGVTAGNSF
jgi:cytidylate kinase